MRAKFVTWLLLLVTVSFAACKKETEDFAAKAQQAEAAGDNSVAIQYYERAVREKPADLSLREHLVNLLQKESRDEQAVPHLMLLVRQHRDDAEMLVRTVKVLLDFGGWKESKEFYEAAPIEVQKKPEVQVMYAELLIREAKFEEALKVLLEVIETPGTATETVRSAKLRRGRLLHQMGRSDAALAEFDALIKTNPEDAEALLLRANLYMATSKYSEAKDAYEALLEKFPKEYEALLGLASLAVQEHRIDDAIQAYEKALAINPKESDVLFWLAELHFERGDKAALTALKSKAQGRKWERELFLGYLSGLEKMGADDYRGALKEFERLEPVLTGYPGLFDKIGLCYLKVGDPTQAEAAFSKLPHDEKIQEQVWSALGKGYLSITNYARAVRWLEVARGKDRLGALTQAQYGLGDLESAYKNARLWLQDDPTSVTARLIAAESSRRLEVDQQGRQYFEQIAASDPNSLAGIYARAQLLVGSNKLAEAAVLLEDHQDMLKTQAGPSLLLAEISLRQGKLEAAEAQLKHTLELDPNYARAHSLLGVVARSKGDDAAAIKAFETALAVDPSDRIALISLGWINQDKEDYRKAAELFERASNLKRPEPEAALFWSLAEFAKPDAKRALQAAERAVKLSPTNAFARYLEVRGNMANGEWDRATKNSLELTQLNPQYAPGEHARALLAMSTNGLNQALQHVQHGLELQKTNLLLQPLQVELLRLTGKPDEAAEKLEKLKQDFPKEPDTYLAEINLLLARKDVTTARDVALKGLIVNPRHGGLQQRLLDTFVRYGQEKDAAPIMDEVLKNDPDNSALRFICARLREERGELASAEAHYQTILKVDPQSVATLNNLALIVSKDAKRLDEAIKLAQRAYVLDGKNPAVADTLAMLMLANGDTRQAATMLDTASKQAPRSIEIRLHLVEALIARGFTEEARRELEKLAKDLPAARERSQYQTLSAKLQTVPSGVN